MRRASTVGSIGLAILAMAAAGCVTVRVGPGVEAGSGAGGSFLGEFTRVIEFGGIERWSAAGPAAPFEEVTAFEEWRELPPVALREIGRKTLVLEGIVEVAGRPYLRRVMSAREDGEEGDPGDEVFWHEYLAARRIAAPLSGPLAPDAKAPARVPTGVQMEARETVDDTAWCRILEKHICTTEENQRFEVWIDVTGWKPCYDFAIRGNDDPHPFAALRHVSRSSATR